MAQPDAALAQWLERIPAPWVAEAPVLAGSALVVALLVGLVFAFGFRASVRLSEVELDRLAQAEGLSVEAALIAPNGRAALARLSCGKLMIARAMGADVSARIGPAASARIEIKRKRVLAAFADTGFPPVQLALQDQPAWLADLAAGARA